MMIDLFLPFLVLVYAVNGRLRGFFHVMTGLLALGAGYAAAVLAAVPAGRLLAKAFPRLPQAYAPAAGGVAAFLAAAAAVRIAGYFAASRRMANAGTEEARQALVASDKSRGFSFGMLQGIVASAVIALVLGLLPPDNPVAVGFELDDSIVVGIARPLAPRLFGFILSATAGDTDPEARLLRNFVSNPEVTKEAMRTVVQSRAVRELAADPDFVRKLAESDPREIAGDPRLRRLFTDPELRESLRRLGLAGSEGGPTPEEIAAAVKLARQALARLRLADSMGVRRRLMSAGDSAREQ